MLPGAVSQQTFEQGLAEQDKSALTVTYWCVHFDIQPLMSTSLTRCILYWRVPDGGACYGGGITQS